MQRTLTRRDVLKALALSTAFSVFGAHRASAQGNRERIVVIGAGMAGISAARHLSQRGYDVTVLEARNEIGGRIRTDTSLGVPLDIGASFIHGSEGNPLVTLASQFGLSTYNTDEDDYLYADRSGKFYKSSLAKQGAKEYNTLRRKLLTIQNDLDTDRTIQSAIAPLLRTLRSRRGRAIGDLVDFLVTSSISIETGGDLRELSLLYFDDDEGYEGPDLLLPGGYAPMVSALAKDLTIQLGTSVTAISHSNSGVIVETTSGSYSADRVVITVALGALKKKSIQFSPELPSSKQGAIARLSMGLLDKIFFKFPTAFWQENDTQVGYFGFSGKNTFRDIPEYFALDRVTGAPILLGFVAGSHARQFKNISHSDVISFAMKRLRKTFGGALPDPEGIVRTSWSDDPLTGGSYSIIPLNGRGEDLELLSEPIDNRVFFAGEATNRSFPGTVHGAYLSGIREAERIIQVSMERSKKIFLGFT